MAAMEPLQRPLEVPEQLPVPLELLLHRRQLQRRRSLALFKPMVRQLALHLALAR